jgi:hypothetical protein
MLSLAIAYALMGTVLGLRFKVMVLMPIIALSAIVITAINMAWGTGLWMATIETVVAAISVQIGYLAGAAIRLFLLGSRGTSVRHTSAAATPRSL